MRTITFVQEQKAEYGLLIASLYNSGGYKSKELKIARRVKRKLEAIGDKFVSGDTARFELKPGEQKLQLEEAEFNFLKERFESIQDWHASAVETAANVLDILEATKEDAT